MTTEGLFFNHPLAVNTTVGDVSCLRSNSNNIRTATPVTCPARGWLYGLELGRVWLTVPITAASMYVLWHWAFGLSFYFGISFVVAASFAVLRGHVFTHPFRMILVAVAVVIGSFVIPSLAGDAWTAFRRGDTITALVLLGVVVLFWLLKRYLETGQVKGR